MERLLSRTCILLLVGRKIERALNKENTFKPSPLGLVLLTLIVPNDLAKKDSLLSQFRLFLSFFGKLPPGKLHLRVLTNHSCVQTLLRESGLDPVMVTIDFVQKQDLQFVRSREGEPFELAFAKIDAVVRSEALLRKMPSVRAIVVTDVDTILIKINPIVKACRDVENIMAINYRSEQSTSSLFDEAMRVISGDSPWGRQGHSLAPAAWINSGFMVLKKDFILSLIKSRDLHTRNSNMNRNYGLIKEACDNHFGDELLFSSIFTDVAGCEIPLHSSSLAQLIWTCQTKADTYRLLNPLNPPAHIHIPALKWSRTGMNLLNRLSRERFYVFKSIIVLNHLSINAHLKGNRIFKYLHAIILIFLSMIGKAK